MLDDNFFNGFHADLQNERLWRGYHIDFKNDKKRLKDLANPTQLGDPVSLKAETEDSTPTENDRGAQAWKSPNMLQSGGKPSLSKLAKDTTIGDPVSLEAEDVVLSSQKPKEDKIASSQSRFPSQPSASKTSQAMSTNDPPNLEVQNPVSSTQLTIPNLPSIPLNDSTALFWSMMAHSRIPDPYILPALRRLCTSSKFLLGALSNTIIFPQSHPYSNPSFEFRSLFSVFIASAEVGCRKPQREIYELAITQLDKCDREKGGAGVKAANVLFLDDIGENLDMARKVGMRTLRVRLGETWKAVEELEAATGLSLIDEKMKSRL